MAKIRGKWEWKKHIWSFGASQMYEWDCKFTSGTTEFIGIRTYLNTGIQHVVYISNEGAFSLNWWEAIYDEDAGEYTIIEHWDDGLLIMDFGTTEQEIDDELYDFITQNACLNEVAEKLLIVAEKIPKVYDAGKQEQYDAFWDALQNKGQRTDYTYGFAFWNSETFCPKYKVAPTSTAKNIFYTFSGLKKLEAKYVDLSQVPRATRESESMAYAFYDCRELEEIEDIGLMPSCSYHGAFANCFALKKIAKITVDEETLLNSIFVRCRALEDVMFDGVIGQNIDFTNCVKLKWGSIVNIVNHLSDSAEGKTLTLSLEAIEATGTDMQMWLEYVGTKPNWTVALV